MLVLAVTVFTACSSDEEGNGGKDPGNGTEVAEGEPTHAMLTFQMNNGDGVGKISRAGSDPADASEAEVKRLRVFIFREDGTFENSTDTRQVSATGVVHCGPFQVTSGNKKIYVVVNADPMWDAQNPGSAAEFEKQLVTLCETPGRIAYTGRTAIARAGDHFDRLNGRGDLGANGYLMTNALGAGTEITLYPGVSSTECSHNAYDTPDAAAAHNHITVPLVRIAAKVTVTYENAGVFKIKTSDLGSAGGNEIGTLLQPTFGIRNLPGQMFLFKHTGLQTPFWEATNTSSGLSAFESRYDETGQPVEQVRADDGTSGSPVEVHIPENASAVPTLGNTTYALIKGTFAPNANVLITDIADDGALVTDPLDYNLPANIPDIPTFTTAPAYGSEIYAIPNAITAMSDRIAHGCKVTLRAYLKRNGRTDYITAVDASSSKDENASDVTTHDYVYYTCNLTMNGGELKKDGIYFVAEIHKHTYSCLDSDPAHTTNKNDPARYTDAKIADIKFLQYEQGICYYRVNIQDNTGGQTESGTPLFYSVMRNRFYNVKIKSISGLGYPNEGDVTVSPNDPVNQKTYLQAHLQIEPWLNVDQDADLGM